MTALTTANVRRLDALNLIEAISKEDKDTAINILAMYTEADHFDNPDASHELARSLAFAGAMLLNLVPDRDAWLAGARRLSLSDETQEPDL